MEQDPILECLEAFAVYAKAKAEYDEEYETARAAGEYSWDWSGKWHDALKAAENALRDAVTHAIHAEVIAVLQAMKSPQ